MRGMDARRGLETGNVRERLSQIEGWAATSEGPRVDSAATAAAAGVTETRIRFRGDPPSLQLAASVFGHHSHVSCSAAASIG